MKNVELRAKFQKNISVYFDASIGGVTSMKSLNILPTPAKDRFNLIVIKTITRSLNLCQNTPTIQAPLLRFS